MKAELMKAWRLEGLYDVTHKRRLKWAAASFQDSCQLGRFGEEGGKHSASAHNVHIALLSWYFILHVVN